MKMPAQSTHAPHASPPATFKALATQPGQVLSVRGQQVSGCSTLRFATDKK